MVTKAEKPVILKGGPPACGIFRPLLQYKLVLVLNVAGYKVSQQSSLDTVVRLARDIDGAIRRTPPDQAVGIVAAARPSLALDRLPPRIHAADMSPMGQRSPRGSPVPSLFTYSKSFSSSGWTPLQVNLCPGR